MKGYRGHRYRALAYGLKILKSPIADSFEAAADYLRSVQFSTRFGEGPEPGVRTVD